MNRDDAWHIVKTSIGDVNTYHKEHFTVRCSICNELTPPVVIDSQGRCPACGGTKKAIRYEKAVNNETVSVQPIMMRRPYADRALEVASELTRMGFTIHADYESIISNRRDDCSSTQYCVIIDHIDTDPKDELTIRVDNSIKYNTKYDYYQVPTKYVAYALNTLLEGKPIDEYKKKVVD